MEDIRNKRIVTALMSAKCVCVCVCWSPVFYDTEINFLYLAFAKDNSNIGSTAELCLLIIGKHVF